jgi:hypothetical protein
MSSNRRLRSACITTLAASGLIAFSQSAQADLLIDLRTTDGLKAANVSSGSPLTLDVWAKVTSPTAQTSAAFQELQGSILSTGALLGNLDAAGSTSGFPPVTVVGLNPFNASGSSNGYSIDLTGGPNGEPDGIPDTRADVDGDGDLDLGKANSDTADGFIFIRSERANKDASQTPPTPPPAVTYVGQTVDGGAAVQWKIGSITFTPTSGASGDTTNVNFVYRRNANGTIAEPAALWFESTGSKSGLNSANMLLGAPVVLTLSGGNPQWNLTTGGSYSLAGNWVGGVPNSPTAVANFLGKITAPSSVSLDGNAQVKQVNFENANSYTITPGTGGTYTIGDGTSGTIQLTQGNHTISAPVRLSGAVAKTGPGTLTLSGPQTNNAGSSLSVSQGQVNLASNAGTSATAGSAAVTTTSINVTGDGAKVVLGSNQDLTSLSVTAANAGLQGLDLASPAGAGQFRAVRIYGGDLDVAKTALAAAIRNAVTTPGDGIFDSGMAAHTGSGLAIAKVADANGTQHVQIRPARIGDLNLDNTVTIADFLALAGNFNGTNKTWQEGDLNNDTQVTIADFLALAGNFNSNYAGETWAISGEDQHLLATFAASIGTSVPEPTTIGLLGVGAIGLLARRRRREASTMR